MPDPKLTEQEVYAESQQQEQRYQEYFKNVDQRGADTTGIHKKYDTQRYTKKAQMSQLIASWREELKDDKEVLLTAVKQSGWTCCYASDRLKGDKDVLIEACKNDGQVLYFASQELRDDKDVVLEAVKNKPIILKYASLRLRSDKDVAIAAVTKGKGKVIEYINPTLRDDEEIKKILEE